MKMMIRVGRSAGRVDAGVVDVGCGLERIGSDQYGSREHPMEMEGSGIDSG